MMWTKGATNALSTNGGGTNSDTITFIFHVCNLVGSKHSLTFQNPSSSFVYQPPHTPHPNPTAKILCIQVGSNKVAGINRQAWRLPYCRILHPISSRWKSPKHGVPCQWCFLPIAALTKGSFSYVKKKALKCSKCLILVFLFPGSNNIPLDFHLHATSNLGHREAQINQYIFSPLREEKLASMAG